MCGWMWLFNRIINIKLDCLDICLNNLSLHFKYVLSMKNGRFTSLFSLFTLPLMLHIYVIPIIIAMWSLLMCFIGIWLNSEGVNIIHLAVVITGPQKCQNFSFSCISYFLTVSKLKLITVDIGTKSDLQIYLQVCWCLIKLNFDCWRLSSDFSM